MATTRGKIVNYEMKEALRLQREFNKRHINMNNQPERSKREDSQEYPIPGCPGFVYRKPNPQTMDSVMRFKYEKAKEICEMRCSEHDGNAVREVQ